MNEQPSERISVTRFVTSWGVIRAASTQKGLAILTLPGETDESFRAVLDRIFPQRIEEQGGSLLAETERQLTAYLGGALTEFSLSLDVRGTAFQIQALAEVARIPYGCTRTYGDVARAIGNPGAVRAVGSANARNPIPLVIPCHRVVAENGLGGYAGGLAMKKRLLAMEGVRGRDNNPDLFDFDKHKGVR